MSDKRGWVKLHRKLLEWQWFDSDKHLRIFLTLLFKCNFKESRWRKKTINPGQLLTGRKQISSWTGIPESSVNRVLKDLVDTGELNIKSTNKYSIISIINWQQYQLDEHLDEHQMDNKRTSDEHQMDTSKNGKNVNNGDNDKKPFVHSRETNSVSTQTASQSSDSGERVIPNIKLSKEDFTENRRSVIFKQDKNGKWKWIYNQDYDLLSDLQNLFPDIHPDLLKSNIENLSKRLDNLSEEEFNKNGPYGFSYLINCLNLSKHRGTKK